MTDNFDDKKEVLELLMGRWKTTRPNPIRQEYYEVQEKKYDIIIFESPGRYEACVFYQNKPVSFNSVLTDAAGLMRYLLNGDESCFDDLIQGVKNAIDHAATTNSPN